MIQIRLYGLTNVRKPESVLSGLVSGDGSRDGSVHNSTFLANPTKGSFGCL